MSRWTRARPVRRDYSRKSFSNPLFETRSGRARVRRGRLVGIIGVAAAAGWVWLAAFSPVFRINDVQVRGAERIPSWEIRDEIDEALAGRRWWFFPKRSLLILSEDDLRSSLNERFVLESLTITKKPPHTLAVEVRERVSAVLLQMPDGSQGLVDLQGSVTRLYKPEEALETIPKQGPTLDEQQGRERVAYPVLFYDKDEPLSLRKQALRPETVQAVIDLPGLVEAQFNRTPYLAETHIDGASSQTLRILTSEGWAIYLDASRSLAEQLENAATILRAKVGKDRNRLEYIDVRFGEKVFFKMKS